MRWQIAKIGARSAKLLVTWELDLNIGGDYYHPVSIVTAEIQTDSSTAVQA